MPSLPGRLSRRDLLKSSALGAGAIAAGSVVPAGAQALVGAGDAAGGGGSAGPLQLARVWFARDDVHLLAGFDDTHVTFDDGSIEVLLWPGDLERLRSTGLRFEVTVEDLVARDRALGQAGSVTLAAAQPGQTATNDYRHLSDYVNDMHMLAETYPDKARVIELPFTTFQRRKVYGLEIATNVHGRDGRAVFYNDGIHHAREWPAAEVPIMWAFDLLENYGSDPRITNIVDHTRNIVVPVVNPDGFNFSREFAVNDPGGTTGIVYGGQGQYVRKNRRSYFGTHVGDGLFIERSKPGAEHSWDVYGIDPNRNYGFSWGGNGSSGDQRAQDARGDSPFSEPESRNVAWILKNHQVTGVVTHHTAGDLILWAWGDTYDDAPDNNVLEGLGRSMAKYNGYRPQKSIQLYPTTGTTSDYAYGALGAVSYTFEHAGSSFHPEYGATVPAMYAKNREALILLCEQVCLAPERRPVRDLPEAVRTVFTDFGLRADGLYHSVLSGRLVNASGAPVAGEIKLYKRFETLLWFDGDEANPLGQRMVEESVETTHATNPDGTFELHVNPSTRPKVEFDGGKEHYELVARAPGRVGEYREVVVKRGQRVDLGAIVLR